MKLRGIAQMRFSEPAGFITRRAKAIADSRLSYGQAHVGREQMCGARVEFVAAALLVATGQQAGAGWATKGPVT